MRIVAISGAVISLLAVVGCGAGSSSTKTVVRTVTAPSTSTSSAAHASPSDCDARGINAKKLGEGTCTSGGTTLTVVNKGSTLRLKSLTATLNGIRTTDSVGSYVGRSIARGRFVLFTLTVTNRLETPQNFDGIGARQTALSLGADTYTEDFNAENGRDLASCLSKDGAGSSPVQPGESITCEVIFDVPAIGVAKLNTDGNLEITNFGEDVSSSTGPIGLFRTYH